MNPAAGEQRPATFHLVSLGCPKNRVDAEFIWAAAAGRGLLAVDDPARADVIVVNTCAFVQSAVEESIDTILQLAEFKKRGRCRRLVVSGCLPARYRRQLVEQLPEVDLFCGPGEVGRLGEWLQESSPGPHLRLQPGGAFLPAGDQGRVNSLSPGAAYLKVAEGCDRRCSFCIIPRLRGPLRSRPLAELVRETAGLVELGVREVVLVAQDLASWGRDLPGRPALAELVEELARVDGVHWLRLMYLFPGRVPERLLQVVAGQAKVLPYFDLPFQHADARVLERMRRGGDPVLYRRLIERVRRLLPQAVLRTSLMTGFPGEDEQAFAVLERFVVENRFQRLGVFAFSAEEGTAAADFPDQVPRSLAERRRRRLLDLQREISHQYHQSLLGRQLEVLVERVEDEDGCSGRAWNQAPEVDGRTVIHGRAQPGSIVAARVTGAGEYDLEVEMIESPPAGRRHKHAEEQ